MTRLICVLLPLLFSLNGPAMGANSDFGLCCLAAKGPLRGSCFAAGTLVATPDGNRAIEDVQVGDTVSAWDEVSSTVVACRVLELSRGKTFNWVDIVVADETVTATRLHPFWSETAKDWVPAFSLQKGEVIRLSAGTTATVEGASIRHIESAEPTYNLIVERLHNYHVGKSGVLVHNGPAEDARMIEALRAGGNVHVKTIEHARSLLDAMPELRPAPASQLPHFLPYDPPGTYRGDLLNIFDPQSPPMHGGIDKPHYNLALPKYDGVSLGKEKAAIFIDICP